MIIAIKEKDKVVIGHSNLDVWDRLSRSDYVDEENLPIKFSSTDKVFACSDMDRRSDVLLYDEELLSCEVTPKSIVRDIIPYIKKRLKENDLSMSENGDWKNTLTICDNGRIYDISPTFGFREFNDFVCHGYREFDGLVSVLDETLHLPAEKRIIKAVSFASKLYGRNLFPIVITDTKDKKFKVINEGEFDNEYFDSL